MAKSRPDHPQRLSANRSVRRRGRPARLAADHRRRAENHPAPGGRDRLLRPRSAGEARGRSGRRLSKSAPFTHASPDRPSRFSAGLPGVLYAGDSFDVALAETVFHHGIFMAKTNEQPGWTSQFREIILTVEARLHDLRGNPRNPFELLIGDQALWAKLRAGGSDGVVYQSVRWPEGECVGLFYPNCARNALQGRHLDYHWDGQRVDLYRDLRLDGTHAHFRIIDET